MAKKVQEEKKELKVVNGYVEIISNGKSEHMVKDEVYKVTEEIANILIKKGVAKAK